MEGSLTTSEYTYFEEALLASFQDMIPSLFSEFEVDIMIFGNEEYIEQDGYMKLSLYL